jgi:hypothetical protein
MIAVNHIDITADVLNDVALDLVSIFTQEVDAKVLIGTAVIQMLSPKLTKTFRENVDLIFLHITRDSFKL